MEKLEIYSKGEYPANILSNFAPNSFMLDGVECASMEGFLQALKFRSVKKQTYVCSLVGKDAKKLGARKLLWKLTGTVYWRGKRYRRESKDFDELISRAYSALYQNETFKAALESTRGVELKHSMGKHKKRSTILTEEEFIANLNMLRGLNDEEEKTRRNIMGFDKQKDWEDFYYDQFLDLSDGKDTEIEIKHEGRTVWFGAYPQSLKMSDERIDVVPNEFGMYKGEKHNYVKVKAMSYDNDDMSYYPMIKFDNGEVIEDKEYFFQIAPIEWQVLKIEGNRLTLIAKNILTAARFDRNTNDYSQSELRSWLNGEFFKTAFNYYEKKLFVSGNDKVRLLTLNELETEFANEFDERKRPTDYAKAMGCEAYYYDQIFREYYGCGWWWLKDKVEWQNCAYAHAAGKFKMSEPSFADVSDENKKAALEIIRIGHVSEKVNHIGGGVVPVIEIELSGKNSPSDFV